MKPREWAGAGLALGHVLTAFFWWNSRSLMEFRPGHLWPAYAEWGRALWRQVTIDAPTVPWLLGFYGVVALVAALCFWRAPAGGDRAGRILLLVATGIKLSLFMSRYTMMGNYHLMHFIMIFVFFAFGPAREPARLVLVLFYFMAGWLKWSGDWLSGEALLSPSFLPAALLGPALAYALVLENFLIWGMLSRKWWIRRLTLAQLIGFHIFSWHIVGYFYPLMMLCLLVPVLPDLWRDMDVQLRRLRPGIMLFATALLIFNLVPIVSGEDPALGGTLRNLRLNMLDARPRCRLLLLLESEGEKNFLARPDLNRAVRVRCDPAVITSEIETFCRHVPQGAKLHAAFYARRTTDADFKMIFERKDECHGAPAF